MAFILNNLEDEDKNKQNIVQTSGESGVFSGTPQGSGEMSTAGGQGSNGWTNLDTYLYANKNQSGQMANDLTKDINNQVNNFNSTDTSSAVNEINKQAGNEQAEGIKSNIVQNVGQAKDFLNKNVNIDPNNYTSSWTAQANKLKGELGQVNDRYYQQGKLQNIYNKPNQAYTSGFGALDSFLLFGDDNYRNQLNEVKTQGQKNVDNSLNTFKSTINNATQNARAQNEAYKNEIKNLAKNKYGEIYNTASGRVDGIKAQQRRDAENKAAEIFAKKKDEYAGFINDGADGDLGFGFIKDNDKFGVNNVVNDDEVAALNALAGIDSGLGLGTITKDNSSAVNFDAGGWESLLSGLGSKRKADKAEEEARARAVEEAKKKAAEIGAVFAQAYSIPEGYNPNQPAPEPAPRTKTKSKEEVIGTDISNVGKQIVAAASDAGKQIVAAASDAGKQIVAAPGKAQDALTKKLKKSGIKI